MTSRTYHVPPGGHPAQTELLTGRAVFTDAYAVIPKGVIRDIVTSYLPHWDKTRVWVLARPLSGFAEPAGPKGSKTRTWVTLKGQPIFAWGGLWRESAECGPVYFRGDGRLQRSDPAAP